MVQPEEVVTLLRAVQRQADKEAVLLEKVCPLSIYCVAVRLQGEAHPLPWGLACGVGDEIAEEVQSCKGRLSTLEAEAYVGIIISEGAVDQGM